MTGPRNTWRTGTISGLSLFQEDRHNALFSQTDTSVSPNITQIENITSARFRGNRGRLLGPPTWCWTGSISPAA